MEAGKYENEGGKIFEDLIAKSLHNWKKPNLKFRQPSKFQVEYVSRHISNVPPPSKEENNLKAER